MPSATNPDPEAARSPSPPPAPPVQSTPGIYATTLSNLHARTLSATLSSISYSAFAECFPSIARDAPDSLRSIHSDMITRLSDFAVGEFERVLAEKNVIEGLNRLETIIEEGKKRKLRGEETQVKGVPPHMLEPQTLVEAVTGGVLNSQQSQLNAKTQTVQSQNAMLMRRVEEQKREMQRLMEGLMGVVGDLEGAAARVGQEGLELARGATEAEGVIGDVEMS